MKHLILCYDLSYADKLTRLASTSKVDLWVVINPHDGPLTDPKPWVALMKDVGDAALKNKNKINLSWIGYVDAVTWRGGKPEVKTTMMVTAETAAYRRDYRAILSNGRTATARNIWLDDCFADKEWKDKLQPLVRAIATMINSAESPGVVIGNAGEALDAKHWLWTACAFVCCFEANEEKLRHQLGTIPRGPANAVMIASANDREDALDLWQRGQALGVAAMAITQRLDYQQPPEWWK